MNRPHTIIIAEAGVNHGGSLDMACKLIREAAYAGADYVKFQTFKADRLVCRTAQRADYQKNNCGGDETQFEMLRRYELTADDFVFLSEECRRCGIGFLSSAFDPESIDMLAPLNMDYWKIPSGEITNLPYLRHIARQHGRYILSTGMSTIAEVEAAVSVLKSEGITRDDITLLHCNTQYPTPMADVNLRAMESLRSLNAAHVGYSDHTVGIEIPVAAVAMGAEMIEKHFTLDKQLSGPDHKASLDPAELREMVKAIRNVEIALGTSEKRPSQSELPNRDVARKSIVAACEIKKGELLSAGKLTVKRPGTGLSPMLWDNVVGTVASRDFLPEELIEL